jgi:hypothetical protein
LQFIFICLCFGARRRRRKKNILVVFSNHHKTPLESAASIGLWLDFEWKPLSLPPSPSLPLPLSLPTSTLSSLSLSLTQVSNAFYSLKCAASKLCGKVS